MDYFVGDIKEDEKLVIHFLFILISISIDNKHILKI